MFTLDSPAVSHALDSMAAFSATATYGPACYKRRQHTSLCPQAGMPVVAGSSCD